MASGLYRAWEIGRLLCDTVDGAGRDRSGAEWGLWGEGQEETQICPGPTDAECP